MKLMIISDIHGYYDELIKAYEIFKESQASYLISLGDNTHHGPRNPLHDGYDPKKTAEFLKSHQKELLLIRGNCESDADIMVQGQPVLNHSVLFINNHKVFLTHGDLYNEDNLPSNLLKGDILLRGHFHIPLLKKVNDIIVACPGSIGVPKDNSKPSYIILDDNGLKGFEIDSKKELFSYSWEE